MKGGTKERFKDKNALDQEKVVWGYEVMKSKMFSSIEGKNKHMNITWLRYEVSPGDLQERQQA